MAVETTDAPVMSLRQRLIRSADVADEPETSEFFKGDRARHWGETLQGDDSPTGRPRILINHDKYRTAGVHDGYQEKAVLGEALHLLKVEEPDRWLRMRDKALADPKYRAWVEHSYQLEGDQRSFDDWHDRSRFDQIIGGYLFAKDPAFPTMKHWDRKAMPFGPALTEELEQLRKELQID